MSSQFGDSESLSDINPTTAFLLFRSAISCCRVTEESLVSLDLANTRRNGLHMHAPGLRPISPPPTHFLVPSKSPPASCHLSKPALPTAEMDLAVEPAPAMTEDGLEKLAIILMGVTGSGKSTFISLLTDQNVEVGHGLESRE